VEVRLMETAVAASRNRRVGDDHAQSIPCWHGLNGWLGRATDYQHDQTMVERTDGNRIETLRGFLKDRKGFVLSMQSI
jgi:hypothetical protein